MMSSASDASAFMTGQTVAGDGGVSARWAPPPGRARARSRPRGLCDTTVTAPAPHLPPTQPTPRAGGGGGRPPAAIIGESVLSFLGLGIRPPEPSLGVMLASAQPLFRDGPWLAVVPGIAIVLLTLALNLFGDGLRDALDPREVRR